MRDAGHRTPDAGHRTAKKAKIIYPPPRGVDIITSDLLNIENFKVAIIQLCNESQVWNFTML